MDQLETFLQENPNIPRDSILVDDYNHVSYKETMGFGRFDQITDWNQLFKEMNWAKLVVPLFRQLGIPTLVTYLKNVYRLAPIADGQRLDWTDLPEGGLRNGGTIVVASEDDQILYRWNDKLPGDVPAPSDVYRDALLALDKKQA